MKARWRMTCECCKSPIDVGDQYVVFAGRPWKPEHVLAYKNRRR